MMRINLRGQKWIALIDCTWQSSDVADARVICVSTSAVSTHSEESDTPRRRTPFRSGNWAASNSALIDANIERLEIGVRAIDCA